MATVYGQGLVGSPDTNLLGVCRDEARAPVTLDREFANPLIFDPSTCSGIAVLRLPSRPTPEQLQSAIRTPVGALASRPIAGKLWIVEIGRIREHQPED